MSQTSVPVGTHRATWLLRQVDGLGHVVVGPPILLGTPWVAGWTGLPRVPLAVFLAVFVAYGVVIVHRTRRGAAFRRSTWTVAAAANLAFAAVVVVSLLTFRLTALGCLLHGATLMGAFAVLALSLSRLSRPGGSVGAAV